MSLPLPASWSKPVADWFAALEREIRQAKDERAAFLAAQRAAEAIPDLLGSMDILAFADALEAALGAFAAAGALASRLDQAAEKTAFLSADPMDFGIKLAPFAEAVTRIDARRPIGAALRSAEWEMLPRELRERAQFSAGVESVQLLNEIQARIRRRLAIETEKLGNGNERFENRDTFISEVRDLAKALGVETARGAGDFGTIRDIRSNPRLTLIYEMQTSQAAEFARRKADLSKTALNLYPAYRLERVESRERPRGEAYWQNRWSEAGAAVNWQGAVERPMVALKTSPIWAALSRFGNPHPPFDYGSGMGTVDVDREEAMKLGLVNDGDVLEAKPEEFNDGLAASAQGVDPALLEKLRGVMGDAIEISGDEVRWAGDTGEMPPPFVEAPLFKDPAARAVFGAAANDVARMAKWLTAQNKDGEWAVAIRPSGIMLDRPIRWTDHVPKGEKASRDKVHIPAKWSAGAHLVHNHHKPVGANRSFSIDDVFTATQQDAASASVALPDGVKTMTAPKGWPKYKDEDHFLSVAGPIRKAKIRQLTEQVPDATIRIAGFDEMSEDAAWKAYADTVGIEIRAVR